MQTQTSNGKSSKKAAMTLSESSKASGGATYRDVTIASGIVGVVAIAAFAAVRRGKSERNADDQVGLLG
jgi:hypothetical protein